MSFKFKRLYVYASELGPCTGSIEIEGEEGYIDMKLKPQEIKKIMDICCDSLCNIAQDASDRMKEVIRKSLEGS